MNALGSKEINSDEFLRGFSASGGEGGSGGAVRTVILTAQQEDCLRRLDAVRAKILDGTVQCIAIVTPGTTPLWQHSDYPAGAASFAMIAGLEACKLDMVQHAVACDCSLIPK